MVTPRAGSSEKRVCGAEHQQVCPLPAAVCHFRGMGSEELWLEWGTGGLNKPQGKGSSVWQEEEEQKWGVGLYQGS